MDAQKVDMFLMTNSSKLPASQMPFIRDRLLALDESKLIYLQTCDFKDPTTILIISVFLGSLGIDRFLIGDIGLGVGKLVTLGAAESGRSSTGSSSWMLLKRKIWNSYKTY